MTDTINNQIPFVPENTIDPAAGLNLSLNTIDALLQVLVQTVGENTPPAGVEGQRHIVGVSPTGAWAGQANKLARFLDAGWQFYDARYALNAADGNWYVRQSTAWITYAGPATAWGSITGTLADQTDLASALGAKANTADLGAVATSNDYADLDNLPTLGTAAATDAADYATAAQGALAGTAVQPNDLATVATSGSADDVSIADAGSHYTSTDAEGALQELGATAAHMQIITALGV